MKEREAWLLENAVKVGFEERCATPHNPRPLRELKDVDHCKTHFFSGVARQNNYFVCLGLCNICYVD